jgi:hypothetical protein
MVAARWFWRTAVTQMGSPPHQRACRAVGDDIVNRCGKSGSAMTFETMP